jgi:hypothetical protein
MALDANNKALNWGCILPINCGLIDSMTLDQAIQEFGSVSQIAEALNISVQAVYKWDEEIPPLRVYQLREKILLKNSNQQKATA